MPQPVYYFTVSNNKDFNFQSRIYNNSYDSFMNSLYFDFNDHALKTPDLKYVLFQTYFKATISTYEFQEIFQGKNVMPLIEVDKN